MSAVQGHVKVRRGPGHHTIKATLYTIDPRRMRVVKWQVERIRWTPRDPRFRNGPCSFPSWFGAGRMRSRQKSELPLTKSELWDKAIDLSPKVSAHCECVLTQRMLNETRIATTRACNKGVRERHHGARWKGANRGFADLNSEQPVIEFHKQTAIRERKASAPMWNCAVGVSCPTGLATMHQ